MILTTRTGKSMQSKDVIEIVLKRPPNLIFLIKRHNLHYDKIIIWRFLQKTEFEKIL